MIVCREIFIDIRVHWNRVHLLENLYWFVGDGDSNIVSCY